MTVRSINFCITEMIGEILDHKFEDQEQVNEYAQWCLYSNLLGELLKDNEKPRSQPSIFDFDNE